MIINAAFSLSLSFQHFSDVLNQYYYIFEFIPLLFEVSHCFFLFLLFFLFKKGVPYLFRPQPDLGTMRSQTRPSRALVDLT